MRVRTRCVVVATAALVAVSLGGCGDGGISLPSGTATITGPNGTATVSVPGGGPSTSAPTDTATQAPTDAPTQTEQPTVTETPTTAPTETPTAAPTETVTATATAEASPASPSPSPSGEAAGPAEGTDDGVSPWWWVLLVLLLLAGIIWFVLARSARRRREEAELVAGIEQRGQWVVDHGVGQLIGAGDPGATQQAWSGLDAALVALSANVHTLARETPADRGGAVLGVRDAVASLQGAAEAHARARLAGDPSPATAAALFDARDRLDQALSSFRAPPG